MSTALLQTPSHLKTSPEEGSWPQHLGCLITWNQEWQLCANHPLTPHRSPCERVIITILPFGKEGSGPESAFQVTQLEPGLESRLPSRRACTLHSHAVSSRVSPNKWMADLEFVRSARKHKLFLEAFNRGCITETGCP